MYNLSKLWGSLHSPYCDILAYLTAGLDILGGGDHAEGLVSIDGGEDHTLALDAHHRARGKVGHEEDTLADEFLWVLVEGSDT